MDEAVIRPVTPADAVAIEGIYTPIVLDSTISFEEVAPEADAWQLRLNQPPDLPEEP